MTVLITATTLVATTLVAAPAVALPGLVATQSTTVGPTPGGLYYTETSCPVGTQLTGGAARVSDGTARLAATRPVSGSNRTWAGAGLGNANPFTSATAIAICASGMSGYETVFAEHIPGAGTFAAGAAATCPAGKLLIGAGGSNAGQPGFVMDGVWISPDLTSVFVRTLRIDAPAEMSPLAQAFGICINPVPGQQRVIASTFAANTFTQTVTVNCPFGTRLHGMGGMLGGGSGRVGIRGMSPINSLTGVSVTARVLNGFASPGAWRIEAYGICAF